MRPPRPPTTAGDHRGRARAPRRALLFTLCGGHISPILVASRKREIRSWTSATRARGVRRATPSPHERCAGRGCGDRRARRHQRHHRAQERADGAVAGDPFRRGNRHGAQGPRLSTRYRSAGADAAADQVGHVGQDHGRPGAGGRARLRGRHRWRARPGLPRGADRPPLQGGAGARLVPQGERRRERQGPGRARAQALPGRPPVPAVPRPAHASSALRTDRACRRCRGVASLPPGSRDTGGAARGGRQRATAEGRCWSSQPGAGHVRDPERIARRCASWACHYLGGMARGLLGRTTPAVPPRPRQGAQEADLVIVCGSRSTSAWATAAASASAPRWWPPTCRDELRRTDARRSRSRATRRDAGRAGRADHRERRPHGPGWPRCAGARPRATPRSRARPPRRPSGHRSLLLRLEEKMSSDAVLVVDGGDFVPPRRVVRPRAPLSWLDPGVFGTLGSAAASPRARAVPAGTRCGSSTGRLERVQPGRVRHLRAHGLAPIAVIGNDGSWADRARAGRDPGDDVGTVLRRTDTTRWPRATAASPVARRPGTHRRGDRSGKQLAASGKPGASTFTGPLGVPQGIDLDVARCRAASCSPMARTRR